MHLPEGTTFKTSRGVMVTITEKRRFKVDLRRLSDGEILANVPIESITERLTDGRLKQL